MKEKYSKVPEGLISGKDLDYLCDMFQWNYGCLKSSNEAMGKVNDDRIKEVLEKAIFLFNQNIKTVLNILANREEDINE